MTGRMNTYDPVQEIRVGLDFGDESRPVGRIAMRDRKLYFEYDTSFINSGLEISPLRLPLKQGVMRCEEKPFEGLPGVFNDSLPDGWGRLLLDRVLRAQNILPAGVSPLDRLAYVGKHGMGALVYEPDQTTHEKDEPLTLDRVAEAIQEILNGTANDVLQEILSLNGSSAGARPKALIGLDHAKAHIIHGIHDLPDGYTPWIVKFANTHDGRDSGAIEYVYALMAKESGILMPDIHLFPAQKCAGYFAVKRFDRAARKRFHMHTACGLLHSDFRAPSLDYEDMVALTGMLTRDIGAVEQMIQRAIFNVLAHNRDDHAKNFSFLMDSEGQWKLSPAYDLTFSSGPNGEQSTMVMGEGRRPGREHLRKLGKGSGLSEERVCTMIARTQTALTKWRSLAKAHGVSADSIDVIEDKMNQISA